MHIALQTALPLFNIRFKIYYGLIGPNKHGMRSVSSAHVLHPIFIVLSLSSQSILFRFALYLLMQQTQKQTLPECRLATTTKWAEHEFNLHRCAQSNERFFFIGQNEDQQ